MPEHRLLSCFFLVFPTQNLEEMVKKKKTKRPPSIVIMQVMPYSTGCSTPLSNFEAGQNYKDVSDPAVVVSFPLDGDADGASMVAWTTTPWTLPSNLALCVNPEFTYLKVRDPANPEKVYIVGESRLSEIPGAVAKSKSSKKGGKKKADGEANDGGGGFQILEKLKGSDLVGKTYTPLFPYFAHLKSSGAFQVCGDAYVTEDSGTGIVHQAPAFGEDDFRVCLAHGVIARGDTVPCPVDDAGCFTEDVLDFKGRHVKEADKDIIATVKSYGRLVHAGSIVHSYPFCWRSDTPLIYRTVPSWFVRVEDIKERLLANNAMTHWVPSYVKEKRFHNWLENARDWAISRSRFWGTPMPVWVSEDGEEVVVVGSKSELEELTGEKALGDLHRHFIDHLTIPSRKGKGVLKRVEDVFDCWFESGSMPYAQMHYPFENKDLFEANFPADFVAEGLDQTRGWFYTLMVLSTALFDRPAFKNLVCNGLVLASDGKKMSKRLKNYPDPMEVINRYGADALRLYLINSPVVRAETLRFKEEGVQSVVRDVFLPWYNAYRFMVQNVIRWQQETGLSFDPAAAPPAVNVLDRWILASVRSLTRFMSEEMAAYRLYTVVPFLVKFIDNLTNVYVRLNRRRLKGRNGADDTLIALSTLFHVLLTLCKAMAPFTPFFTEMMYQNLRRVLRDGEPPASLHWCEFPHAEESVEGDEQLEVSISRMQRVIDHARLLRDRHNRPVKTPFKEMTVVSPDAAFLADLTGELQSYVAEEVNVRTLTPCADPLKFANLRAEPDWPVLGKRLGKRMAQVAAAIRALSQEEILRYEQGETLIVEGEEIGVGDMKVLHDFKRPESSESSETAELDAAGDGEVLVVVDLSADESLLAAGTAREVVNRVQKLRKKAGLAVTDVVEVFVAPLVVEHMNSSEESDGFALLLDAVKAADSYVVEAVGQSGIQQLPLPVPVESSVKLKTEVAREQHTLTLPDGKDVTFEVVIFRQTDSEADRLATKLTTSSIGRA